MNLKDEGIDLGLALAGLMGAILTSSRQQQSLTATVASLLGGAASANYVTPLVLKLANLDGHDFGYAIAFLLGFLGLRAVENLANKLIPSTPSTDASEHVNKPRRK
jgi:hypothetical protein